MNCLPAKPLLLWRTLVGRGASDGHQGFINGKSDDETFNLMHRNRRPTRFFDEGCKYAFGQPIDATVSGSVGPDERPTAPDHTHEHLDAAALDASGDPRTERLLLRALINSVPEYLFIKDTKSHFVVANPAIAEDLGLSVVALIGKTDFDLHECDLAEKFFREERKVISAGRRIDVEEISSTGFLQRGLTHQKSK